MKDMTMINKAALTILLGSLAIAGASGAFAQSPAPAAPPTQGGAMPGMPMNGKPGMQGMMMNEEMMQKMSKMMDNCNKMMETMMQNKTAPSGSPAVPKPG